MYLYVAFFSEDNLFENKLYLNGRYVETIKNTFTNFYELNVANIEGCIGFLIGKENRNKKCFALNIRNVKLGDDYLYLEYDIVKELDITSGSIYTALYKFARQSDWIDEEIRYYPLVCIVEKNNFDAIRKDTHNIIKVSNNSAKIDRLKSQNDWAGICSMFEPLEKVNEREDIWNNAEELYNLAFACSKLGEPKNGMERDNDHLKEVKRYRELSISFYKRCYDLEPYKYAYPSALAYRYYLNVMELTKPKGRRDGKAADEITEAILWFDKALSLYPNSIRDNYRKGKLILDKQIANFRFTQKEWTRETFQELNTMEQTAISCLNNCIDQYENNSSDEEKKRYYKEYVRSLYQLGCYYLNKAETPFDEYACCKLVQVDYYNNMTVEDMKYLAEAKSIFEKCFEVQANIQPSTDLDFIKMAEESNNWYVSLMDILYRLGLAYCNMYFVKLTKDKEQVKLDEYRGKAEVYLLASRVVGDENRKIGNKRNTEFINEKIAWYYILKEDYDKAIKIIERSRDSYIKNTYAIALMLSNVPDKYQKAEAALSSAENDRYNKAKDTSIVLMAYLYKLSEQQDKYKLIMLKKDELSSSKKQILNPLIRASEWK